MWNMFCCNLLEAAAQHPKHKPQHALSQLYALNQVKETSRPTSIVSKGFWNVLGTGWQGMGEGGGGGSRDVPCP